MPGDEDIDAGRDVEDDGVQELENDFTLRREIERQCLHLELDDDGICRKCFKTIEAFL